MRHQPIVDSLQQNKKHSCFSSTTHLVIHLDRRLTWQKHIFTKRKQLGLQFHRMYWIIGRKSKLPLETKLLIHKTILKPIWTYGIPLWGTANKQNVEILQVSKTKSSDLSSTPHGMCQIPSYIPTYRYPQSKKE